MVCATHHFLHSCRLCRPPQSSAVIIASSHTYNIYVRRVLSGEFQDVLCELVERGLWDEVMHNLIIANNGSMQNIDLIQPEVKADHKTIWEFSKISST